MDLMGVKTNHTEPGAQVEGQLSVDEGKMHSYLEDIWPFNRWFTLALMVFYLALFPLAVVWLFNQGEIWPASFLSFLLIFQLGIFVLSILKKVVRKCQIERISSFLRSHGDRELNLSQLAERVPFLGEKQLRVFLKKLKEKGVLQEKTTE